jgi:hypothetical protein
MEYFAGLDISMDETHICILDRDSRGFCAGPPPLTHRTRDPGRRQPRHCRAPGPISPSRGRRSRARPNSRRVAIASGRELPFLGKLLQKRLRILQIRGIEALGEPAVDGCEKVMCLWPLTLIAPQPSDAHCGAEFP